MNDDTDVEDVLLPGEVAAWLRLAPSFLYRLTARNAIPHYKIGGRLRFSRSAVKAWLAAQPTASAGDPEVAPESQDDRQDARSSSFAAPPRDLSTRTRVPRHGNNGAGSLP